jgi:uncharacterized lipoprotein YmbA
VTRAAVLNPRARAAPGRARRFACGAALATALAVALGACASHRPEHFYTVAGAASPSAVGASAAALPAAQLRGDAARVIRVDPLLLPELINRPQLVLRSADHEVKILEADRWAGPLADDLGQVLRADLQQADPANDYVAAGGPRSEDAVWQLQVQIGQLDAGPATDVRLQAAWVLRDRARAPLAQGVVERVVPAGAGVLERVVPAGTVVVDRVVPAGAGTGALDRTVPAAAGEPAAIVQGYGAAMRALAAAITESVGALRRADPAPADR